MIEVNDWDSWHLASTPSKKLLLENDVVRLRAYHEGQPLPQQQFSRFFNPISAEILKQELSIFGGVSFEDPRLAFRTWESELLRRKAFTDMIAVACTKHHLRLQKILFYYKTEFGANGRPHGHFLIAKDGLREVSPKELAITLDYIWEHGTKRRGSAQIDPFCAEDKVRSVLYQTKYEWDVNNNPLPIWEFPSERWNKLIRKTHEERQQYSRN